MDKVMHFFAGGALFALAQVAGLHGVARYVAPFVAGVGKEVSDVQYHSPMREHAMDLGATMLGALAVDLALVDDPRLKVPVASLRRSCAAQTTGPRAAQPRDSLACRGNEATTQHPIDRATEPSVSVVPSPQSASDPHHSPPSRPR